MGRKEDRKRIAFGEKHEVDYLKRILKEQEEILKAQRGNYVWGYGSPNNVKRCSKAKLLRICKALRKALKCIK